MLRRPRTIGRDSTVSMPGCSARCGSTGCPEGLARRRRTGTDPHRVRPAPGPAFSAQTRLHAAGNSSMRCGAATGTATNTSWTSTSGTLRKKLGTTPPRPFRIRTVLASVPQDGVETKPPVLRLFTAVARHRHHVRCVNSSPSYSSRQGPRPSGWPGGLASGVAVARAAKTSETSVGPALLAAAAWPSSCNNHPAVVVYHCPQGNLVRIFRGGRGTCSNFWSCERPGSARN